MLVLFSLQRLMASPAFATSASPSFPQPPRRDSDVVAAPKRAHSFANRPQRSDAPDAFDTRDTLDIDHGADGPRASVDLDDLPIELISLTDSFLDSLDAKVHPTPPNIERLSQLFQEFYTLAASHIATHTNALATRQSREASAPPASSISSAASRLRSKASAFGSRDRWPRHDIDQQMITADELASRKRARKALESKRVLLEEAVERRLCQGIYDRIYRHRSTQDEAQDDKLRSKTAALALVGINLADLGVDLGPDASSNSDTRVRQWLHHARANLTEMSQSRYPLGKLNHLKAAHKSIVDTLAHFHPSASADEVMPMLIYTLITMPPEGLHIISDVHFVQNFRWEPKLTGEAAYCLTNLEAAISFLQNVDLATLREDEHPSGPPKAPPSHAATPRAETFPPAYNQGPAPRPRSDSLQPPKTASTPSTTPSTPGLKAPDPDLPKRRRLSDLVNTPAQAIGAASDAVISTADQGLKTISSSLGDSYSFLLGKLRERHTGPKEALVPRTLDDARKLVSTPPPTDDDDTTSVDDADATADPKPPSARGGDRVLGIIAGRRDPSVDSSRSASSSSKKVPVPQNPNKPPPTSTSTPAPAVLDQVRNLGSSFNPMARLSNIGGFRPFARTPSASTPAKDIGPTADGGDLASAFPDIAAALPPKPTPRLAPPVRRFIEMQSPGDLRLGDVIDLLRDYRRLAGALKDMGAFDD
ncbi:hypothetical protein CDD82_2223 [Ophiocordyceps australis]|uniref:VPS9 domain-containing protein n=1 Tax=Ophiocordyceps australis TaxID=1399860 RepID=A0A2C5XUB7_9HYPO|nr:hypothetical protein CDD82_2223 [Ophiocordyceps australis]